MTTSNFKKVFRQLTHKPFKLQKYIKHNAPKKRGCGFTTRHCRRCGRHKAHIDSYGLDLCRQCFREVSTEIGFKKYG